MLVNKQEEFKWKVIRTIDEVSKELIEQKGTLPSLKTFRSKPGFTLPADQFQLELMKPPTIAQKFTEFEINEKLSRSLAHQGLKNIQFEFGAGNITARVYFYDFWNLLSSRYHFYQVLSGGLVLIPKYSTDLEIFTATNFLLILK